MKVLTDEGGNQQEIQAIKVRLLEEEGILLQAQLDDAQKSI